MKSQFRFLAGPKGQLFTSHFPSLTNLLTHSLTHSLTKAEILKSLWCDRHNLQTKRCSNKNQKTRSH